MGVYVDRPAYEYRVGVRKMIMCHMIADTLEELHNMADNIGIRREWFQNTNNPHYDICKSKRALAVSNGAIELDRRDFVKKMREIRS